MWEELAHLWRRERIHVIVVLWVSRVLHVYPAFLTSTGCGYHGYHGYHDSDMLESVFPIITIRAAFYYHGNCLFIVLYL